MKKLIKAIIASLTVLAAFTAFSCKQPDTALSEIELEEPKIQVKAFPGYNFVAWEPVEGASKLYVYRDDGTCVSNGSGSTNSANKGGSYIDINVQNGETYTYTAYAMVGETEIVLKSPGSETDQTLFKETYREKGSSASCKIKAIVPPEGTSALDLVDYDSDSKKYKLNAENIKVEVINNRLWVSFPTKGYLYYEVAVYKGNELEVFDKVNVYAEAASNNSYDYVNLDSNFTPVYNKNFYSVNGNYAKQIPVSGPGKYSVQVIVGSSLPKNSSQYPESSKITAKQTVEIIGLDTKGASTSIKAVEYVDEKTIRVIWVPAADCNKNIYAPENYKVYFQNNFTGNWTEISSKTVQTAKLDENGNAVTDKKGNPVMEDVVQSLVKSLDGTDKSALKGKVVYYVDFNLEENGISNEVTNKFRVMLSKDDKYEDFVSESVTAYVTTAAAPVISVNLYDLDGDGIENDAIFTVKAPVSTSNGKTTIDAEIASVAYTFLPSESYEAFDTQYSNACTLVNARGDNTFIVKDVPNENFISILAKSKPLDATTTKITTGYARTTCSSAPKLNAMTSANNATLYASVAFADVDADKDMTSKDVYFKVTGLNETQTVVNAKYATGKTAAIAQSLLFSENAVELAFNKLETVAYSYEKDIEKGLYVALYAEVEEAGELNKKIIATTNNYAVSGKVTLDAAHKNTLDPEVSVKYVDLDNDGLENDAVIYVKPVVGSTLKEVKYATNENETATDILLGTTLAKPCTLPAAEQYAYTFLVKDIAKDEFITVYAKAEKDVNYGYKQEWAYSTGNEKAKAKAADEGFDGDILTNEDTAASTTDALQISWLALDADGLANDALIELTLTDPYDDEKAKDDVLVEFGWAKSFINDKNVIYSSEYNPITIPTSAVTEPKQIFYYYIVKDIEAEKYAMAYAKVTRKETFDVHTVITSDKADDITTLAAPTVSLNWDSNYGITDITKYDNIYNDLQIDVELGDDDSTLDAIYYVIVEKDSDVAELTDPSKLLRASNVQKMNLNADTYTNYIKDVPAGAKVYVLAKVTADGFYANISDVKNETCVNYRFLDPTTLLLSNYENGIGFVADSADATGKINDIGAFTLHVTRAQTIKSVTYYTDRTAAGAKQKAIRNKGGKAIGIPQSQNDNTFAPTSTIDTTVSTYDSEDPTTWIVIADPQFDPYSDTYAGTIYDPYNDLYDPDNPAYTAPDSLYNPNNPIFTDPTNPEYNPDGLLTIPTVPPLPVSPTELETKKYEFKITGKNYVVENITKNNYVVIKVVVSEGTDHDEFTTYFEVTGSAE